MPDTKDQHGASDPGAPDAASGPTADREIDPKLLEILVCPMTKAPLRYDRTAGELISDQAGLAFPIRNGVAIMLVDEARTLNDDPVAAGAEALSRTSQEGSPK